MAGKITMDNTGTDVMQIGNTTYEITSFYTGEMTLMELLKNALRRDAQAVLRQQNNPLNSSETS